jgi:hypothetical protein
MFTPAVAALNVARAFLEEMRTLRPVALTTSRLARLLEKHVNFFRVYGPYASSLRSSLDQALSLSKTSAHLQQLERDMEASHSMALHDVCSLASLLMRTATHFHSYVPATRELLQVSPPHEAGYQDLAQAVSRVADVCREVDAQSSTEDGLRRLVELQAQCGTDRVTFVAPHTKLLDERPVTLRDGGGNGPERPARLVLLSDTIVFVVERTSSFPGKQRGKTVLHAFPLSSTRFAQVSNGVLIKASSVVLLMVYESEAERTAIFERIVEARTEAADMLLVSSFASTPKST